MASLVERFQDYSSWRAGVTLRVRAFRRWLEDNELLDGQTEVRLTQLLERLGDDKLTIAFVAEFSRGKSELINAIFFADYGRRLLPSSTGRTTMCPTELAWDPAHPPCIQLLPIETRAAHVTIGELKKFPDEWSTVPLDVNDPQGLVEAFQQVRVTKRVPIEEAKHYGLFATEAAARAAGMPADGMVEIPCWRHAIINFPHPLLEQGLVILDTPGLNAIGSEPELTLNLLPNAHALLFVLSIDTGVSKSDIEVWRDHLAAASGQEKARFVVLNKIDSLWDGLRTDEDIAHEVGSQVQGVGSILGVPPDHVLAVSAQKGLVAKITDDDQLLARSRLPELELALSSQLIPAKHEIVRDATRTEVFDLLGNTRAILDARLAGVLDQLTELRALRGKNLGVVEGMMARVRREKEDFERGLARFQALRGVFALRTNELFTHLGMDALKEESRRALREMSRSQITPSLRSAMVGYFEGVRAKLESSGAVIAEIHKMMEAMYRKFSDEHGLHLGSPQPFSLFRYVKEFDRLERNFRTHFDTIYTMVTHEKLVLIEKFFETLASQVRRVYTYANREAEQWLRAVMSPLETQVREHQIQLRRRLESIKRIHQATDALEDRISELEDVEKDLVRQLEAVHRIAFEIEHALDLEPVPLAAAA
jgi:hypothetical protein